MKGSQVFVRNSASLLGKEEVRRSEEAALEGKEDGGLVVLEEEKSRNKNKNKNRHSRVRGPGAGAINTTKHLWAGAVAAMVSRYWERISYSLYKSLEGNGFTNHIGLLLCAHGHDLHFLLNFLV